MKTYTVGLAYVLALFAFVLSGCGRGANRTDSTAIVGAWYARVPGAPFEYQMYLFNSDGTMQESNPDAGDADTSDSSGFGAWSTRSKAVIGKFVEVTASRRTHRFVSRGEISLELNVDGDRLNGTATGRFYDARGKLIRGPVHATIEGTRVHPR